MSLFKAVVAKNESFALEVGSSSVKVLQMVRQGAQWSIIGAGHSPINRSVVADKNIVDTVALAAAIEKAVQDARIKSKSVVTAMPSAQAIRKTISLPRDLNEIEQENYVQVEAPNHIQFPLDEVRMDFEILGINASDPSIFDAQIVAVKDDVFQQRLEAISAADLEVKIMDIDEFAIERAMRFISYHNPLNTADGIEVLVDIGHEFTDMYVLKDGRFVYNREQNFGMKQLTDEVSRRYGLSVQDVQQKMSQGLLADLPEDYHNEIIPQFRSEVANQVNRLIQFFFAATSHNRVHRIWIAGGGGGLSGITDEVYNLTGVTTQVVNPLSFASADESLQPYINAMGPSFLTAFGLAIRED